MFANIVMGLAFGMSFLALLAVIYTVRRVGKDVKFMGQCVESRRHLATSLDTRRGEQIRDLTASLKKLDEIFKSLRDEVSSPLDARPSEAETLARRVWAAETELKQLRSLVSGADERIRILETNGVEESVDQLNELLTSVGNLFRPPTEDFIPGDEDTVISTGRGMDGNLIAAQETEEASTP